MKTCSTCEYRTSPCRGVYCPGFEGVITQEDLGKYVRKADVMFEIISLHSPDVSWSEEERSGRRKMMNLALSSIREMQPEEVVPWHFLDIFSKGKRHNFDSDFVLEAKQAWEESR